MISQLTILVTGGAGFIGSHLCENLLSLGNQIICIDSFDDYYDPALKHRNIANVKNNNSFTLFDGDIRDKSFLENIFRENKIDIVIHLAARAGVRPSIELPELYFDVNVNGTVSLLEVMRKYNVKKMLFASSSSVYGNSEKVPFCEEEVIDRPVSPYAASKRSCELICATYNILYDFNIFCLRFFTVYGPRQRPEMAINKFFTNILESKKITLYGNGELRRDYTYIDDILDGIIKSINCLKGYEVFNLGESRTISLIELIKIMEGIANKKAIIEFSSTPPGDVLITYSNIEKAKNVLNYSPRHSIEEGLFKFYKWKTEEFKC